MLCGENDGVSGTPPEIAEAAKLAIDNLMPTKSSSIYEGAFQKFTKWCKYKNVSNYCETTLLAYFCELATKKQFKSSTMWANYSMIKTVLSIKHGVDISKYLKLRAFLKKHNEGYSPKKSRVFTKEQVEKFFSEAPNEKYLAMKIVLIIGVSGACRCDEMVRMKVDDIENMGSLLHIKIPNSKTKKSRSFTVVGENFLQLYRQYASLRPSNFHDRRFFVKYGNGKCYRSVMGVHKIGSVPREVASYLKLPHPEEYTGHGLRRTSATLLVDGGGDLMSLKRLGGWKSSSVAEGYIEESLSNKKDSAMKIFPSDVASTSNVCIENEEMSTMESTAKKNVQSSLVSSGLKFENSNVTNCTFNLYFSK